MGGNWYEGFGTGRRGWDLVGGVGNWYVGLGTGMRGWELV